MQRSTGVPAFYCWWVLVLGGLQICHIYSEHEISVQMSQSGYLLPLVVRLPLTISHFELYL